MPAVGRSCPPFDLAGSSLIYTLVRRGRLLRLAPGRAILWEGAAAGDVVFRRVSKEAELALKSVAWKPSLHCQKPAVAIKQFNPAFDDDFQPDVSMDPDRERAERQKLRRKTKKEMKGAIRELRKDNAFLSAERDKERRKRDAYLEARGKRALSLLEQQEHSVKEMRKERRKLSKL